ncbi:DUF883 family protein [Robbsia betulipollinis]|nr:DUF883 domain-containing protein [Robbsia betulipollinis]
MADDAVQQTRKIGGRLSDRASSVIDDGSDRLKSLIDDLESALKSSDLNASSLRDSVRSKLDTVRSSVTERGAAMSQNFNDTLGTADDFAHEKPWQVIGAVAGIALVIGFLAGRS